MVKRLAPRSYVNLASYYYEKSLSVLFLYLHSNSRRTILLYFRTFCNVVRNLVKPCLNVNLYFTFVLILSMTRCNIVANPNYQASGVLSVRACFWLPFWIYKDIRGTEGYEQNLHVKLGCNCCSCKCCISQQNTCDFDASRTL